MVKPKFKWAGKETSFFFSEYDSDKDEVKNYTFFDFFELVFSYFYVFEKEGINEGDLVSVLLPLSMECFALTYALMFKRAVVNNLFYSYGEKSIQNRIDLIKPKVIITDKAKAKNIPKVKDSNKITLIEDLNKDKENSKFDVLQIEENYLSMFESSTLAFLHYTSGTTGFPKVVPHKFSDLYGVIQSIIEVFKLNDNTSYLCTADYGWVTGIYYNLLFPLLTGVHSYLIKNLNGFSLLKSLKYFKEWKIEHLYTSPLFLKMAYRYFKKNKTEIRSIYSVGEKLPDFLKSKYHNIGYDIVDTWWQTELGCISISNDKAKKGMGVPLSFVNTALLIDNKVVAKKEKNGKTGELLIDKTSHPSIMSGYYHDEKANKNKFIGKYYRTGDLVKVYQDGHFEYISRADDVIVVAGELISPDEVESLIMKQFDMTEISYVMCNDNKIRLFVTQKVDIEKIKKLIFNELNPVMVPYEVVFIETLPKTESSKIKKSELRRYSSNE